MDGLQGGRHGPGCLSRPVLPFTFAVNLTSLASRLSPYFKESVSVSLETRSLKLTFLLLEFPLEGSGLAGSSVCKILGFQTWVASLAFPVGGWAG